MSDLQKVAEQVARYCNAMVAYETRQHFLGIMPETTLKNALIGTAEYDKEYIAGVEQMDKAAVVDAITEFECGGAVEEASKQVKYWGIDVSQLETVRKFGTTHSLVADKKLYCFLVMPDDNDPAQELTKIFDSGYLTRTTPEETDDGEPQGLLNQWHLNPRSAMDIVKIINFFDLQFVKLDNSEYAVPESTEMGDLVYGNTAGVRLEIYDMEGTTRFIEWAPQLKDLIEKAK